MNSYGAPEREGAPRPLGDAAALAEAERVLAGGPGAQGRVRRDAPLGPLTTYRVGGPAALLVIASENDDLVAIAAAASVAELPILVVGRGSNLLVSDAGFGGIAVILDPAGEGFGEVVIDGTHVTAGAAVALPALARQVTDAGLTGLEWAVGVPGSVGGGVRMNAGGHGSDIAHVLLRASVAHLGHGAERARPVLWPVEELGYAYRHSRVGPGHFVLHAEFGLTPGDAEAGRRTIREIVRWRREHQPGGQNAGSVFTNPPDVSAGWLVEAAGLKGHRIGTAAVSPKHANFIQADPDGSADDVLALIRDVQDIVRRVHAVDLQTEVRLVGFPDTHVPAVKGRHPASQSPSTGGSSLPGGGP